MQSAVSLSQRQQTEERRARNRFEYTTVNMEISPTETTLSLPASLMKKAVRVRLKQSFIYGVPLVAGIPTIDFVRVKGLSMRVMSSNPKAQGLLLPITGERTHVVYGSDEVLLNSERGQDLANTEIEVTDQNGAGTSSYTKIVLIFEIVTDRA